MCVIRNKLGAPKQLHPMRARLLPILLLLSTTTFAQLTVEKIMRDPKWIGTSPSNVYWSDDSKNIYFTWNPDKAERDALYTITPANITPQKVSLDDRRNMRPNFGEWNKKHTIKLYEKNGDIFMRDFKTGK